MSVRTLSIRAKLIGAFSLMVVLITGLGVSSLIGLNRVDAQMSDIAENWVSGVREAGGLNTKLIEFRLRVTRFVMADNPDELKQAEKELDETLTQMAAATAAYEKTIVLPEDRAQFNEFMSSWEAYRKEAAPLKQFALAGERSKAVRQLDLMRPIGRKAGDILTKL